MKKNPIYNGTKQGAVTGTHRIKEVKVLHSGKGRTLKKEKGEGTNDSGHRFPTPRRDQCTRSSLPRATSSVGAVAAQTPVAFPTHENPDPENLHGRSAKPPHSSEGTAEVEAPRSPPATHPARAQSPRRHGPGWKRDTQPRGTARGAQARGRAHEAVSSVTAEVHRGTNTVLPRPVLRPLHRQVPSSTPQRRIEAG